MTARNHGVIDNNNSSEAGLTFFPKYLRGVGCQTAFIGKWHMGDANDRASAGLRPLDQLPRAGKLLPDRRPDAAAGRGGATQHARRRRQGNAPEGLHHRRADRLRHGLAGARPRQVQAVLPLSIAPRPCTPTSRRPERWPTQYSDLEHQAAGQHGRPENNRGKPMWVRNQRNSWHGVDYFYNQDRPLKDYMREYYRGLSPVDDSVRADPEVPARQPPGGQHDRGVLQRQQASSSASTA
ncbi:hypothetical protein ACRAWD_14485 [Caulobacter segnis]